MGLNFEFYMVHKYLPPPPPHSTGRRFRYAHGDLEFSLNYSTSPRKRRQPHDLRTWRSQYASSYASLTLLLRSKYDTFVALLYPFLYRAGQNSRCEMAIMKIPIRFYYDIGASTALLLRSCRFCCDSRHIDQNFKS